MVSKAEFQFPPPQGGELWFWWPEQRQPRISIPAPARGRTCFGFSLALPTFISIPAPARGRTCKHCNIIYQGVGFQFPPQRGGELENQVLLCSECEISIPAPARGRTAGLGSRREVWKISIPAPARGRTDPTAGGDLMLFISIPAPARGRTAKLHKIEQSILSVC